MKRHRKIPQVVKTLSISLLLSTPLAVFSQITLKVNNMPLRDALKRIESVSEYKFFYNERLSNLDEKTSFSVNNADIESTMEKVLSGLDISYKIEKNNIIVLLKKEKENSQTPNKKISITGKVIDENKEAIIGASVSVNGTTLGTITDIDGKYQLDNVPENSIITVSFIGFNSVNLKAKDMKPSQQTILKENSKMLDEVVVVGYGTQRKALVTNAISSFKPNEANIRPVLSPGELLQGRVAGVTISTGSGNLGSSQRMSIRGAASLSASNEPLYVIDGVPIMNSSTSLFDMGESMSSLSTLNLTDIESIEVLKDAASAAIYG